MTQLDDEDHGEAAEDRLGDPVVAERPADRLDQPGAERGEAEHQGDDQPDQQAAVAGRAQRRMERPGPRRPARPAAAQRGELVGPGAGGRCQGTGTATVTASATTSTPRVTTAHIRGVIPAPPAERRIIVEVRRPGTRIAATDHPQGGRLRR